MGAVAQPQGAAREEGEGVAAVARRQDAVEHVHAGQDRREDVRRHADAHQVAGPVRRQQRGGISDRLDHLLVALADAQAAEGIAVEADVHDLLGAPPAEIEVGPALDNAEEQGVRCQGRDSGGNGLGYCRRSLSPDP